MNHKSIVHKHIVAAIMILAVLYAAVYLFAEPVHLVETAGRLLLPARLMVFIALPLLAGVGAAVHARYSDASMIHGYQSLPNEHFKFLQAYTSNTLEQASLQAMSLVAFCAVVPEWLLVIAYAQVGAFLLGRFMFFVGYQKNPLHRLAGFAVGYYPSILATGLALWFSLRPVA